MTLHVLATGGTIASHLHGDEWLQLTGADLIAELTLDHLGDEIVVEDVAAGPSSNLGVTDMLAIAARIADAATAGATGVVVTHGTDTIELSAFVADLVLGVTGTRPPVVFTGSMRAHSHPAPDGPGNLLDALTLAAHPAASGREVMVCLDGAAHAADHVAKVHAASLDAFTSHPFHPIATVRGREVELMARHPDRRAPLEVGAPGDLPDIPLITCYPGIDATEVATALDGRRAAVLEVFGDLNVPRQLWRPVHEAAEAGTLVVLASRAFTDTTGTDDLTRLGAIGAGGLSAQKARLALVVALACGDHTTAIDALRSHRRPLLPDLRSSRHD